MKKAKIIELLTGTLKAKIITGVVAAMVFGGAVTGSIIYKNNTQKNSQKENSFVGKGDEKITGDESKIEAVDEKITDDEVTNSNKNDSKSNEAVEDTSKSNSSNNEKGTTTNNQESSNGGGISNGGGNSNSGGSSTPTPTPQQPAQTPQQPTQPQQPQQPQQPTYTVGVDSSMTSKIRALFTNSQAYSGIKVSEYKNMTVSLANGSISESSIGNLVNNQWQEDLTGKFPGVSGNCTVKVIKANAVKFNMPSNMEPADVSFSGKAARGNFTDVVAYRNSDGTYTISSIGINFGIIAQ